MSIDLSQFDLSQFDERLFQRQDNSPDSLFYAQPRKVVHIDVGAIEAATNLYRKLLPANGTILDLMSSWRSHLPQDVSYQRVCGLGMNGEELDDNPQLTEWLVHDLNQDWALPFADGEFTGACCCVSVQYMQQPQAIFAEVARVLAPNAPFIVIFSNRCFSTKAINAWRMTDDAGHIHLVESYFAAEPRFCQITKEIYKPTWIDAEHQNPLYAVWGYRQS